MPTPRTSSLKDWIEVHRTCAPFAVLFRFLEYSVGQMGRNHVLRGLLETEDYSCFNDESCSPGFYADPNYPPVNSAIGMPASSEFGSIFRLVTNVKPNDVLSGRGKSHASGSRLSLDLLHLIARSRVYLLKVGQQIHILETEPLEPL